MEKTELIKTLIEWTVGISLVVGFIFEEKFIRFEERFARRHRARKNRYASYNPCEGLYWR